MKSVSEHDLHSTPRLAFWLLTALLVILWFAGGASRADVAGQAACRFFAWLALSALALGAKLPTWKPLAPLYALLGIAVLGIAYQLLPLPPAVWGALPGHALFVRAAEISGQPQPWRPISISSAATANALASMVVPGAVLILCASLSPRQHWRIAVTLLVLVFAGCLLAVLQMSGAALRNPLINQVPTSISGNFSNRNHFALFVAAGCLLAAVVGVARQRVNRFTSIGALVLLPFFLVVILGVGSRAGLVLGILAAAMGLSFARKELTLMASKLSPRTAIGIGIAAVTALLAAAAASVYLNRATALNRTLNLDAGDDLRSRALPYVIDAAQRYFPFGSGFGTFDPAYRIEEPHDLLRLTYFNHAHNDWLETVMTGGALGALLLVLTVVWYGASVVRLWKDRSSPQLLPAAGAGILFLFMLASFFDYPLRTPLGTAIIMIAAVWLQQGAWARPQPGETGPWRLNFTRAQPPPIGGPA